MGNSSGANRTQPVHHGNPETSVESRLTTTSSSSSADTSFSLPFSELLERPKHKIICGYLKKVGKRLAGSHTRWVVIYSSFQLETCKDEQSESTPTKVYNLMDSNVQYGKLGTGEFALKIYTNFQAKETSKRRRKDQITLLFYNRREMQQWVGGIRCLFAGTENSVLNSSAVGGESCVICLDDFIHSQVLSVLPCNHRFCPACIKQWLEISSLCPCCKRDATVDGVLVIHTGKYNKEVKIPSYEKSSLGSSSLLTDTPKDTSNNKKGEPFMTQNDHLSNIDIQTAPKHTEKHLPGNKKENSVSTQHDKRNDSEIKSTTESLSGGVNAKKSKYTRSHIPENGKEDTNPFAEHRKK